MIDPDQGITPVFDPASALADCQSLITDLIVRRRARLARPVVVGLCGPQGSGKSTMANRLTRDLARLGLPSATLSLDDFYLCRSERLALARNVHPLLATRGVPGTHDIGLAIDTLSRVLALADGARTVVPVFDKMSDDRAPPAQWRGICGPVDLIILEGWCVGATPQPTSELVRPANALEREEDRDGRWRMYVNEQLGTRYQQLFGRLDANVLLRAPDFEIVHQWRAEQEAGLRPALGHGSRMDDSALRRFVAHYQRLTCWMQRREPADLIIDLNASRVPTSWHGSSSR